MIRLITAGAMGLLLAGCTAEKKDPEGGSNPAANGANVAAETTTKFELGKPI